MTEHSDFVIAEGLVHFVNPGQAEYTLCGDAFDLASDIDGYGWENTKSKTVTCPSCAAIIRKVRGVRTKTD